MAEKKKFDLRDYKILAPNMLPVHFKLLTSILKNHGYDVEILMNEGPDVVSEGLKNVHNDTCYPALLVIGQMIDALKSGKYDLDKTALMITQSGGGCRASNYIHLLRKALEKQGLEKVPVISLNLSGLEKDSGLHITLKMLRDALAGMIYGDALMLMGNQTRPYENVSGETDRHVEKWRDTLTEEIRKGRALSIKDMKVVLHRMIQDFESIPVTLTEKTKVGVVGEIYIKYSSLGNNHLEDFLRSEDCEVMVPGILQFLMFKVDNRLEDIHLYGGSKLKRAFCRFLMKYLTKVETVYISEFSQSRFTPPGSYVTLKSLAHDVIGSGCKMGEGWLLTAEILELIHNGYGNVVCAQPFGCLPNHIVGKGMIRKIREMHPGANVVPVDYDPGATRVNQENRIKLMLAVAREG